MNDINLAGVETERQKRRGSLLSKALGLSYNQKVANFCQVLSGVALLIGVILFVDNIQEQVEERVRKERNVLSLRIRGESGKKSALEYLNSERWPFKRKQEVVFLDMSDSFNFGPVILSGIDMKRSTIVGSKFDGARLDGADFSGSRIVFSSFKGANFRSWSEESRSRLIVDDVSSDSEYSLTVTSGEVGRFRIFANVEFKHVDFSGVIVGNHTEIFGSEAFPDFSVSRIGFLLNKVTHMKASTLALILSSENMNDGLYFDVGNPPKIYIRDILRLPGGLALARIGPKLLVGCQKAAGQGDEVSSSWCDHEAVGDEDVSLELIRNWFNEQAASSKREQLAIKQEMGW